ncbi:PilZ domain-containing protein [Polynucleobacter sp. MWH-UH25E]|uniref:PilZ domain-containing protein n=1 Tax=Polynucleobacter sp. MWH-UH25E TaxID=1855616 RepID=UPI001BFD93CE|nr:PilZ domain-containing protein [Polynucleobacter sp. MWH-UH25E]QWD61801.1 PilZ domain-containing protein [Polynucleobacter sp. MWH-UH25E]
MKSKSLPRSASSVKQRARADRVQAALPITLGEHFGKTRDISATGIYFEMPVEKELGSQVDFVIDLDTPGGALKMQCIGEVVRVQNADGKFGIAVKITSSELK